MKYLLIIFALIISGCQTATIYEDDKFVQVNFDLVRGYTKLKSFSKHIHSDLHRFGHAEKLLIRKDKDGRDIVFIPANSYVKLIAESGKTNSAGTFYKQVIHYRSKLYWVNYDSSSTKLPLSKVMVFIKPATPEQEKLIAKTTKDINWFIKNKKADDAYDVLTKLLGSNPNLDTNIKVSQLVKDVQSAILTEEEWRKNRPPLKKSIYSKNGLWRASSYVDNFGDPTKSRYVGTVSKIKGTFSNSATTHSPLNVDIMISNKDKISFMLFEYARGHGKKTYSSEQYSAHVKSDNGTKITVNGEHYSDRVTFRGESAQKLFKLIKKSRSLKFVMNGKYSDAYYFTINANGFSEVSPYL